MNNTVATRLPRAAAVCSLLSLLSCATTDRTAAPPPEAVPAWARQALVVRTVMGFRASLTAWERDSRGWRRTAGPLLAVVGRNGFAPAGKKREGDGRTPSGIFRLGLAFGRPASLKTGLHYRQATDDDYWVDDPASPQYNQWVRGQPAARSWEKMRPSNGLYDAGIVVEYNTAPTVSGRGSAIFIHLWEGKGKKATAGCVALRRDNLIALLRWLDAKANPVVVLGTSPPAAEHAPSAGGREAPDAEMTFDE